MSETLEQMEARHAAERAEFYRREIEEAYRAGMEGRPKGKRVTLRIINEEVAEENGLNAADLLTPTRSCTEVAHARFAAYDRAHKAGFSLSAIGKYYERDHTTVMHGIKRHKEITLQNAGGFIQ